MKEYILRDNQTIKMVFIDKKTLLNDNFEI